MEGAALAGREPIHPLGKDWRQSLREDREAFILADELGFAEGYVGEHVTDAAENITSCAMFIATLVDATKRIRLGTGTINMPNNHPAAVAANIAMLDHLLDGRFNFGISPGGLLSDAEVFGNLNANRNEMFVEAINQVLAIWAGEAPYNIEGKYWKVTTQRTLMADIGQGILAKPLQKPASAHHRDGSGAVLQGRDGGRLARLGARNRQLPDAGVGQEPLAQVRGGLREGRPACGSPPTGAWRARSSSPTTRRRRAAYVTAPDSPYRLLLQQPADQAEQVAGRAEAFQGEAARRRTRPSPPDGVMDKLVIWGSPAQVADKLLAFRKERWATSAPCCTPARTGSTATSAAAPWCCWRKRCCRP